MIYKKDLTYETINLTVVWNKIILKNHVVYFEYWLK